MYSELVMSQLRDLADKPVRDLTLVKSEAYQQLDRMFNNNLIRTELDAHMLLNSMAQVHKYLDDFYVYEDMAGSFKK